MTPMFTYEQAVLLSRIPTSSLLPGTLCLFYYPCAECPVSTVRPAVDANDCIFTLLYPGGYDEASTSTRSDMRLQFPPEQYPELYI